MADARAKAHIAILSSIETYNPASYRGGILTLHYARAQESELWLDLITVRGEVVVQVLAQAEGGDGDLGAGCEAGGGTDSGAAAAVVGRERLVPVPEIKVNS
jgi:hypothetical protein